jgi:hypothetical protein
MGDVERLDLGGLCNFAYFCPCTGPHAGFPQLLSLPLLTSSTLGLDDVCGGVRAVAGHIVERGE